LILLPQETIRRKRDGETLDAADIAAFIDGLARDRISEGQAAAFAMAVYFKGMSRDETVALTLAMRDSGDVLDWSDIGLPIADKHSTGGVGDNVSLMLAPIVAACGVAVPMISGRGLGHTGGTLDKLESIPGYDIAPDATLFRKVLTEAGCAIIGQTANLAPADRRLYAIRDITATVESVPLITASILSKKLAAGLQSLVLDVKIGSGAFMQSRQEAETLARSLVEVANGAGVKTTALITDMNQPLADTAGNTLEIINCLDFLAGKKAGTRLEKVVMAFATEMLLQAGVASGVADAHDQAMHALSSGRAQEHFARMVSLLGGPADFIERPHHYLTAAPAVMPVVAKDSGWLTACETRNIGMAVVELGGGRTVATDSIDHRVGLSEILPLSTRVEAGDTIALVHAANDEQAKHMATKVAGFYSISDEKPKLASEVIARII
jgi:thymidine phosphorylase